MIIKTIDRFIANRLILASVVVAAVFSSPVILISLYANLPSEVLFSKLALAALDSIVPMILYHTLPLLVAAAIVCCYAQFSADGTLVAMHLAGLSHLSVRAPALSVATGAMALGYALSCWVAPSTASHLHDVLYSLRHELNPALLRVGQFNTIDGRQVLFFQRWLNNDEIADVFIRQYTADNQERVYSAKRAVFEHGSENKKGGLVLFDGSMQTLNGNKTELRNMNFNRVLLPLAAFGDGGSGAATFVDELGPLDFLRDWQNSFKDPVEARSWMREAVKRLGIPALALIHTIFGLEFLARWSTRTRERYSAALICALIGSIHFAVVVLAEQAGLTLHWAWAAIALIGVELATAMGLMIVRPGNSAVTAEPMAPTLSDWRPVVSPVMLRSLAGADSEVGAMLPLAMIRRPHDRGPEQIGHSVEDGRQRVQKIA